MTGKQDYRHFEEIQNGGGRQLVCARMVILAMLSTLGCPFAAPFLEMHV